jgi:16S rRNA (guanine527-N7)-methyltransferase
VSTPALFDRLIARAAHAGVHLAPSLASALVAYMDLLARWNRRINLTSLPLEPAADAAIDRLVVESLVAAPHAGRPGASVLDVGSGAGSPAIPLKLARPDLRLVMVEARARKSAFLREAVRSLGLEAVGVATGRLEDLIQTPSYQQTFDSITVRAVRLEQTLLEAMARALRPGGRLLEFASVAERPNVCEEFTLHDTIGLPGGCELRIGGVKAEAEWE